MALSFLYLWPQLLGWMESTPYSEGFHEVKTMLFDEYIQHRLRSLQIAESNESMYLLLFLREGMKMVQKMGSVPTGANDRPLAEMKIFRAYTRALITAE